jgi:hypothetical protein
VAGVSGTALQFGGDDFLEVPDSPSLDPTGSFTIETWIRLTGTADGMVVNKGGATRTYRVALNSSRVQFRWHTTAGTENQLTTSSSLSNNTWHHIACVYDQTAGQNRIYVNGILSATGSASGAPSLNAKILNVGCREPDQDDLLTGTLDELQITLGAKYTSNFTPTTSAAGEAVAEAASRPGTIETLAYPAGSSIDVDWNPPSGSVPLAGYRVYRSINGGSYSLLTPSLVTDSRYTDLDMVNGQHCYRVTAVGTNSLESTPSNTSCVSPPTSAVAVDLPDDSRLGSGMTTTEALTFSASVRPNPLRRGGMLIFTITQAGPVRAELYDLAGRRVSTLIDVPQVEPGRHEVAFARGESGAHLPAGIYLYRVVTREGAKSGRIAVLD